MLVFKAGISQNVYQIIIQAVLEISHLPACPSQVEFAGDKLRVSDGCPVDFQKIILHI